MEYELQTDLVLLEVSIAIPYLGNEPNVSSVDQGDFKIDRAHKNLLWNVGRIDGSNSNGCLEFGIETEEVGTLYPIKVHFRSKNLFSGLSVDDVVLVNGGSTNFSADVSLLTEGYEIA